jgi:hypothetical protein
MHLVAHFERRPLALCLDKAVADNGNDIARRISGSRGTEAKENKDNSGEGSSEYTEHVEFRSVDASDIGPDGQRVTFSVVQSVPAIVVQ